MERFLDIAVRADTTDAEELLEGVWQMLGDLYELSDSTEAYAAMATELLNAELARLEAKYAGLLAAAVAP